MANFKRTTRIFVHNEVGVTLTETSISIGETLPLIGKWAHCLGQQFKTRHLDGEFTFTSGHDIAVHAHPVTKVERCDIGETFIADNCL